MAGPSEKPGIGSELWVPPHKRGNTQPPRADFRQPAAPAVVVEECVVGHDRRAADGLQRVHRVGERAGAAVAPCLVELGAVLRRRGHCRDPPQRLRQAPRSAGSSTPRTSGSLINRAETKGHATCEGQTGRTDRVMVLQTKRLCLSVLESSCCSCRNTWPSFVLTRPCGEGDVGPDRMFHSPSDG